MISIKSLRLKLSLSQREIAKELNISQNTFSQYENGLRQPDISLIPKLAEILQCSIEDIVYCFCD